MPEELMDEATQRVKVLHQEALQSIQAASSTGELEQLRVQYTGKRSALNEVMKLMAKLDTDGRKALGEIVNGAKEKIQEALEAKDRELRNAELRDRLEAERLDVTLPGREYPRGYRSPLLATVRHILDILGKMGFSVYEGPDVEWDRYNFELLNIPRGHPSRDIQDTFYVTDDIVLRTQTSPAQIRIMETHKPPLRVCVPGFCYRNEAEDASHGDRFYQIEGLAVDRDISLTDLKGTLAAVAKGFFGPERPVRFRPHYFPFTEPSAEVDIQCAVCRGTGCRSCGGEGWLELGGSGMVHPKVLENVGIDPEEYSGFAFGIGPDRYAMVKYGITDLRLFRENDLRFLRQFS